MRLELRYCDIKAVVFITDHDCYINENILYINKRQLIEMFGRPALDGMDIQLAVPGERCRIVNVGDVVQPRAKLTAPETTFPGFLGTMSRAGDGITVALKNVTVMECLHIKLPHSSIVDMSGSAADYTEYSKTFNIVILASPCDGIDDHTYINELKKMVFSISRFLAELAFHLVPDITDIFELKKKAADCVLPKVVHVWVSFSHARNCEMLFYGQECLGILPTIVHPNEILDGAIVNRNYRQISNGEPTYALQNHALLRELYARDGKDVDFRGVILINCSSNSDSKKCSSLIAATLAAHCLEADIAIITKEGGGHPQLDMAMCSDSLNDMGIKSVMIIVELMASSASSQESLIFNTPTANAIVSGGILENLLLPAMDRVIGSNRLASVDEKMNQSFTYSNRWIRGSLSQIGGSYVKSITY